MENHRSDVSSTPCAKRLLCRRIAVIVCDSQASWNQEDCGLFETVRGARHCKFLSDEKFPNRCVHPDAKRLLP